MTGLGRRSSRGWVVGVGALGALVSIVALSLTWGRVVSAVPSGGAATIPTSVMTGRDAAPSAAAASWASLAGLGVMLLVGGATRRWIGVLVALLGAGIMAAAVDAWSQLSARATEQLLGGRLSAGSAVSSTVSVTPSWAALVMVGGALVVVAGCAAAASGHLWSSSASITRPRSSVADRDPWAALDAGVDPTAEPQ